MYPCKDEDFAQFYELEPNSMEKYESIRRQEHGFQCIDWEKLDITLFGSETVTFDYSALDFIVVPC